MEPDLTPGVTTHDLFLTSLRLPHFEQRSDCGPAHPGRPSSTWSSHEWRVDAVRAALRHDGHDVKEPEQLLWRVWPKCLSDLGRNGPQQSQFLRRNWSRPRGLWRGKWRQRRGWWSIPRGRRPIARIWRWVCANVFFAGHEELSTDSR